MNIGQVCFMFNLKILRDRVARFRSSSQTALCHAQQRHAPSARYHPHPLTTHCRLDEGTLPMHTQPHHATQVCAHEPPCCALTASALLCQNLCHQQKMNNPMRNFEDIAVPVLCTPFLSTLCRSLPIVTSCGWFGVPWFMAMSSCRVCPLAEGQTTVMLSAIFLQAKDVTL